MKLFNSDKTVAGEQKAGGDSCLPLRSFLHNKIKLFFIILFFISAVCFMISWFSDLEDKKALEKQQKTLREDMQKAMQNEEGQLTDEENVLNSDCQPISTHLPIEEEMPEKAEMQEIIPEKLPEYEVLHNQNEDFVGWLKIEGTVIDYPVMQCAEDENFYLSHDFYREENKNGSLVLDNDSVVGIGTAEQGYTNDSKPTTNLIIHGHTMKSGQMFGNLKYYQDKEYGDEHRIICFDSLYEKREYELIAVFYSQVFYQSQDVFKYYKFFQADTQAEFDDWYNNIKELSLYDTGVTAKFGDEFITLSCCAYHVEDGRFVVVGKRVYR